MITSRRRTTLPWHMWVVLAVQGCRARVPIDGHLRGAGWEQGWASPMGATVDPGVGMAVGRAGWGGSQLSGVKLVTKPFCHKKF